MPQYNPSLGGSFTRALSRLSPVVGGERRWVEKIVAAAEISEKSARRWKSARLTDPPGGVEESRPVVSHWPPHPRVHDPPTRESQTPPRWDYFESYFLVFLPTGAHSRKMSKYDLLEICHTGFWGQLANLVHSPFKHWHLEISKFPPVHVDIRNF